MKVIFLLAAFLLSGCVSLNSVSLTPVPVERGKPIQAQGKRMIFVGFNFDNDFVDDATKGLVAQCPNGRISGILTKDETIMYFIPFVWAHRITATGYCEMPNSTAAI